MSHNKLSGMIPQCTQFGGQNKSSFGGNISLCGLPLQESIFRDKAQSNLQSKNKCWTGKQRQRLWPWSLVWIGDWTSTFFVQTSVVLQVVLPLKLHLVCWNKYNVFLLPFRHWYVCVCDIDNLLSHEMKVSRGFYFPISLLMRWSFIPN